MPDNRRHQPTTDSDFTPDRDTVTDTDDDRSRGADSTLLWRAVTVVAVASLVVAASSRTLAVPFFDLTVGMPDPLLVGAGAAILALAVLGLTSVFSPLTDGVRAWVGRAIAVVVLVVGVAYLVGVASAPDSSVVTLVVAFAVGLLVVVVRFRSPSGWNPDEYTTRFEAYRKRLDAQRELLKALYSAADINPSTVTTADATRPIDPELRVALLDAQTAFDRATARLDQATTDLARGLPGDALHHFYSAKREVLTIDYGIERLKDHLLAASDAADPDAGSPAKTAPDGGVESGEATSPSSTPADKDDDDGEHAKQDALDDDDGEHAKQDEPDDRLAGLVEQLSAVTTALEAVAERLAPSDSRTRAERYLATMTTYIVSITEVGYGNEHQLTVRLRTRLLDEKGRPRPDVTVVELQQSIRHVHDRWEREARVKRTTRTLLRLGTATGIAGLVALFALAIVGGTGAFQPISGLSVPATLAVVSLFGLFGALTSVLFYLKDVSTATTEATLTAPQMDRDLMAVRLLVGTLMGVLAYVLVTSGLLVLVGASGVDPSPLALTVAFAAGFVERLVTDAIEGFTIEQRSKPSG